MNGRLPQIVREALAQSLGLAPEEVAALQIVVRVSQAGWSHHVPAARLFLYRDGRPLATVKRIPRHRLSDAALILAASDHLAAASEFRVPRRLAAVEDVHALYVVEELIPARDLASALAAGQLSAATATAALQQVLRGVWALRRPLDPAVLARDLAALRAAGHAVLGEQPAVGLIEAALAALSERHRDELATVFTSHDIHIGNILRDDSGTLWLTDFDLSGETALFGLDVHRAWFHSAPLPVPLDGEPCMSAELARLCLLLSPLFEYQLQEPHLPPPERAHLRRYAEDLFVRLALPSYHAAATYQATASDEVPQAQIFLSYAGEPFSEANSMRFPFEPASGRMRARAILPGGTALTHIRLDPSDRAHSVLVLHAFTLTRGNRRVDLTQAIAQHDGVTLVDLRPIPGAPRALWAASDDPQLIIELQALEAEAGAEHIGLELELEWLHEWTRQPAYDPAALLARLSTRLAAVDATLDAAADHLLEEMATARRRERRLRQLAAQPHVAATPSMPPPAPLRPAQLIAGAAALARRAGSAAWALLRATPPVPGAPAATGVVHSIAPAGRWPAPLISVVVRDDSGIDAPALLAWLGRQTIAAAEAVEWSARSGVAMDLHEPTLRWRAADWSSLCATLGGRYVVVADAALLRQPPVHLEVHAIALESEDLDFALTASGHPAAAAARLAAGRLPGATRPLAGSVARIDAVAEGMLDVSAMLARHDRHAAIVGALLAHPTALPLAEPADGPLPDGLQALATRLLAAPPAPLPVRIDQPLRLVDAVLEMAPLRSPLPTVLTIFPFLAVGGAERVALDVMQQLADRVRFVVVSLEPAEASLGTTADRFRAVTPYVYTAPDFLAAPLTYSLLAYLIGRFAPQTLYIANGCAWIYDALPTLKAHYPQLRTVNQVYDQRHGWIERYDAGLVAALDAHIGCNAHICAAYRARGAPAARVHEVPHGIDTDDFDPARFDAAARAALRARFGLDPARRTIAFLSRLHPQKRPMDFVELARQLRGDATLQFLMVGDGPLRADVEQAVAASGLSNFVLHRFHHPSRELFAVADVVVLPSAYEGMPLVVLEAQAMGVPVVTTDVGNTRELLAHGGGIVVDTIGDVGALRRGLRTVLETPPDAAAMRAAVAGRWGAAVVAEQYRAVLLGENGKPE